MGQMLTRYFTTMPVTHIMFALLGSTLILFADQFLYLASNYWVVTERISKGPVIWVVSTIIIQRELSKSNIRQGIALRDLLVFFVVMILVFM